MTSYLVLARCKDHAPNEWQEHQTLDAHNAEEAIRKSYMSAGDGKADVLAMVAVPARSWKPTPIRTEKTERIVLGIREADDADPED